jgi:hypothetical protein
MLLYSNGAITANQLLRPLVQELPPLSCAALWHEPLYPHEEADMYQGNSCHEEGPSVIESIHTSSFIPRKGLAYKQDDLFEGFDVANDGAIRR